MKKNIFKIAIFSVFSAFSLISCPVKGLEQNRISATVAAPWHSRLYGALNKENNFMVSPVSLKMAMMTLASEDKAGKIRECILNFYGISDFEQYRNSENDFLIDMKKNNIVDISNSIWYNIDNIPQKYRPFLVCNCLPGMHFFSKKYVVNSSNAVRLVNSWVYKKTHGKIKEIIDSSDFSSIILNTTYFNKKWEKPFPKALTHKNNFYNIDGSVSKVDFMHRVDNYNYYTDEDFEMVEIPYEDNIASMYVFLPKNGINDFNYGWLERGFLNKRKIYLGLSLPKFREETSLNLTKTFKDLGLSEIFNPGALNGTQISDIIHKTYINFDEEGTEAAAVTGIIAKCCLPPQFNVNKPFVYVISENQTGKILFMGQKTKF